MHHSILRKLRTTSDAYLRLESRFIYAKRFYWFNYKAASKRVEANAGTCMRWHL